MDFYQDGLRRFRKEGQALVALHNQSGIVSCRDFFRRNNTAYLVMEFEAGMPLSQVLQERESEGRPFCEEDLMEVAVPLLEGLGHVHEAGIVHRDIKPSNLLVREADGEPVLLDFGAAKHDAATQTKSMAPRTPGYAAWEQIVPDGELGPWTDIYAIGVLLWRIVAGGAQSSERRYPVPVERRMDAVVRGDPEPMPSATELGRGRFNPEILAAIDYCLKLRHDDRIQDCTELLGLLRLDGEAQYGVAMRIYRRIPGYGSRNRDSRSEESDYSEIRNSPLLAEVVEWLSLAAEKEHGAAQYELAFLHHHGIGARHDPSLARDLLHRSADSGHYGSQLSLAFIYGFAFIHSRYKHTMDYLYRNEFRENSEVGLAFATYLFDLEMPDECYRIYPTKIDYEDSNLPHLAARYCVCGDPCMRKIYSDPYRYPFEFIDKRGNLIDAIPKVLADYIKSRVGNDSHWGTEVFRPPPALEEAQYEIGCIFELGELVPKDLQKAVKWYRLVAEPERKQREAGSRWTTKQLEACRSADARLRALAKANIDEAREYCWNMYSLGRIVPKNVEDAFNWIQFGATQGNPDAQYHLGWMYWNGKGVSCNDGESVKWFRAAARSGNPHAQNSLGVGYFWGRGVVQSYAKAQAWFLLAAANYGINRPDYTWCRDENIPDRDKNIPDRILYGSFAIDTLLNCLMRDDAMRHAIEWEDQASHDCYLSAYNHLAKDKEEHEAHGRDFGRHADAENREYFSFDTTTDFFHEDGAITFKYSRSIDLSQCKIPEVWMFAFRMHPWDSGCLRAVYNFAVSRFIQFYSAKHIESSTIQPEHWFLSLMSWLSAYSYPLARYIRSICIANENPCEAFAEMCLAADQNHRGSQAILSLMYTMSEGFDSTLGLLEIEQSNLSMRRYWIDAIRKFSPSGYGRESLNAHLTRSINSYCNSRIRSTSVDQYLGVEQSQFDFDPWGIWGFDVSVCRLFPSKWYEMAPLFHSGDVSDSFLGTMRSYAGHKAREYSSDYYEKGGECEPNICRNVPHVRILREIRSAAFRGDPDAQFAFGALYASGDGVTVDYALAVEFLREAAKSGNAHACNILGMLYEHGHGVAGDDQKSKFWYSRSQVEGVAQLGSAVYEGQDSIYLASVEGAIVGSSPNASDRFYYLFYQGQAQTPCSWTEEEWRWWFASTLGCRLSQRWATADFWRPSWGD